MLFFFLYFIQFNSLEEIRKKIIKGLILFKLEKNKALFREKKIIQQFVYGISAIGTNNYMLKIQFELKDINNLIKFIVNI